MNGRLRSNSTPGTTRWAARRAQWTAIASAGRIRRSRRSRLSTPPRNFRFCFIHLDELATHVAGASLAVMTGITRLALAVGPETAHRDIVIGARGLPVVQGPVGELGEVVVEPE